MTKTYKFNNRFNAPRDKILELMSDPKLREDEAIDIAHAIEANCTVTEPREGTRKLVLEQKEYGRDMKGKRDKSVIEDITLTMNWDTVNHRCEWSWSMASQKDRVFVSGKTTLIEDGNATKVLEEGRVEVKVPMIGKMIEGKVVAGIEKARPKWAAWFEKRI